MSHPEHDARTLRATATCHGHGVKAKGTNVFLFLLSIKCQRPNLLFGSFTTKPSLGYPGLRLCFNIPPFVHPSSAPNFKLENADHTACLKAKEQRKPRRQGDDEGKRR